jgi:hypothetical protein
MCVRRSGAAADVLVDVLGGGGVDGNDRGGEGGGEGGASYDVLNAAQITFTGVFVVEMCVKILAVGIGGYV